MRTKAHFFSCDLTWTSIHLQGAFSPGSSPLLSFFLLLSKAPQSFTFSFPLHLRMIRYLSCSQTTLSVCFSDETPAPPQTLLLGWNLLNSELVLDPCVFLSLTMQNLLLAAPEQSFVSNCSLMTAFSMLHVSFSLFSLWLHTESQWTLQLGIGQGQKWRTQKPSRIFQFPNSFEWMFYTVTPNESSFQTLEEVADYVTKVKLYWKMLSFYFLKKK